MVHYGLKKSYVNGNFNVEKGVIWSVSVVQKHKFESTLRLCMIMKRQHLDNGVCNMKKCCFVHYEELWSSKCW